MFVTVLSRKIEFELVAGHDLMASGAYFADCRQRIFVGIPEEKSFEFHPDLSADSVVVAVSEAKRDESVVACAHGYVGCGSLEIGLYKKGWLQFK